jgi:hypothetical protein
LFGKGLGPTGLDKYHDDDNEEELLMDFIIGGITKDYTKATKTRSSVGL